MTRKFLGAAGAAVVVVALAGCGGGGSESTETTTTTAATTTTSEETTTASSGAGQASVTIDGKAREFSGSPTCIDAAGNVNITIGEGTSGILAVVSQGEPLEVVSVGLGNVDGAVLAVGAGQGNAEATKDGNTYTITGTATGVDTSNPLGGLIDKPFEIKVTCP